MADTNARVQRSCPAIGADPKQAWSRLSAGMRGFTRSSVGLIAAALLMLSSADAAGPNGQASIAESDRISDVVETLVRVVQHGELRDTKYMERLLQVSFKIRGGWLDYEGKHYMSAVDLIPDLQRFNDGFEISNYTIYTAGEQLPGVRDYVASLSFVSLADDNCFLRRALTSKLTELFGTPDVRPHSCLFSGIGEQAKFRIVVSKWFCNKDCLNMVEIEQIIER